GRRGAPPPPPSGGGRGAPRPPPPPAWGGGWGGGLEPPRVSLPPPAVASRRRPPPQAGEGVEQASRPRSLRAGGLDHDRGLFPVLAGRGVLQDQHPRPPIVGEQPLGAGERHRRGGPALERAGLERLDERLRLRALRLIERLRDDQHVAEAVERGIDRGFFIFLLVRLGERRALVRELLLGRVVGDEEQL